MRSHAYRVWDVEDKQFIDLNVFVAPDGYLYYMEQDSGWELLTPDWFDKKMLKEKYTGQSSVEYARIGKEVEALIREQQQEWFIVEFATGYQDSLGAMIYDGDLLAIEDEQGVFRVLWGHFDDCCVEGDTWILQPQKWQCCVYQNKDDCRVIGNIHENPDLFSETIPLEEEN